MISRSATHPIPSRNVLGEVYKGLCIEESKRLLVYILLIIILVYPRLARTEPCFTSGSVRGPHMTS